MTARLLAVKALQKLTSATVSQKQQTAVEKVQHAELPGDPPLPYKAAEVQLPLELQTPQVWLRSPLVILSHVRGLLGLNESHICREC